MKGDKRIKQLKKMALKHAQITHYATIENPYQDVYLRVFIMETDDIITDIIITQQIYNYVEDKEYFNEIQLSPKDFESLTRWITENLTVKAEAKP